MDEAHTLGSKGKEVQRIPRGGPDKDPMEETHSTGDLAANADKKGVWEGRWGITAGPLAYDQG